MGESLVGHIPSKENIADLPTKVLYGHKRRYLVSNIVYGIHDDNMLSALVKEKIHTDKFEPIGHRIIL